MDSYTVGYFVPIVIVLIVATWMMATGFSKENQEKIDKLNRDHLAGAVADGIRRAEKERPVPTKCPSCGRRNPASANFCSACGTSLSEEEA